MSHSYKKSPVMKDGNRKKRWDKRQANKAVRHANLASGCAYKRVYNQYDICDYKWEEWDSATFTWCTEEEQHKWNRRLRAK